MDPADGKEQLTPSDVVLASPPIASISPGGTQVVRLVLRQSPGNREATYRIVLDQIPPPATPGMVRVVLRMSIPVFAQPVTRTASHLTFHIERDGEKLSLVGVNSGTRHEVLRDIVLSTRDGRKLQIESGASPYALGGVTRYWSMKVEGSLPGPEETCDSQHRPTQVPLTSRFGLSARHNHERQSAQSSQKNRISRHSSCADHDGETSGSR